MHRGFMQGVSRCIKSEVCPLPLHPPDTAISKPSPRITPNSLPLPTYIMRSFVAGAAALLAGVASAQEFRAVAYVVEVPGETYYQQRVWYGDGNLYVGARVPEGVQNALNFTSTLTS